MASVPSSGVNDHVSRLTRRSHASLYARHLRESISHSPHGPQSTGVFLGSPIARAAIARDIEEDLISEHGILDSDDDDFEQQVNQLRPVISHESSNVQLLSSSYGRPSFTHGSIGQRSALLLGGNESQQQPTRAEQLDAFHEERSLLRDNNLIPPKHPQEGEEGWQNIGNYITHHLPTAIPGGDIRVVRTEEEASRSNVASTENTPLLGNPELPYGGLDDPKDLERRWEEAIAAGQISTTWQREAKTISKYSAPLILTFILQYSLTVASVLVVGRIGVTELAAVSLATMTASITGSSIFIGLASSLDTLCAQAYGSGKKKLVGLQVQRGIFFLWTICIPIGVVWLSAESILVRIVPDPEVAKLAGLYLKIVFAGAPGWAAFESGKRFVQAQGLFNVGMYVLLVCAPLNALMNYLFVWTFGLGFKGAPLAVAITNNLLPISLFLYVRFVDGMQCWPGFTIRAFHNWGPMIKLALPGLLMVESECLAFEILTLAASYFGTNVLAAQSVVSTIVSLAWQIPFPLSVAMSTRVANLIGATLVDAAQLSAKVGLVFAITVGTFNALVLALLRSFIPRLFTSDETVINIVATVLPLCAAFQLFDAIVAWCNGTLRGIGRPDIGGYVQLFCYYAVAMPISFGSAFALGWGITGLWLGCAVALSLVGSIEMIFIWRADWNQSVEDAKRRNETA